MKGDLFLGQSKNMFGSENWRSFYGPTIKVSPKRRTFPELEVCFCFYLLIDSILI